MNKLIHFDIFVIIVAVLIFSIIGISSNIILDKCLDDNVYRRAVYELNDLAKEQSVLVEREIERQFIPLDFFASYLNDGNSFNEKESLRMIDTLVSTNTWCTLGFADLDGNAISYDGKILGNVSQRLYFKEIVDGIAIRKVEYLSSTNMVSEPRFIFSVPVYKDKELVGVLFASKELSVMEPILLSNDTEENHASIFVVSSEGTILCTNSDNHAFVPNNNFYSIISQDDASQGFFNNKLFDSSKLEELSNYINSVDKTEIIACYKTKTNDWSIIVTESKEILENQYRENLTPVRKQVVVIMSSFGVLLSFIVISSYIFLKTLSRVEHNYQFEKIRNDIMMNELGCELFVYNTRTEIITTEGVLHEKYGFDFAVPLNELIKYQRPIHPECNFERIKNAFIRSVNTGERQELVFMLSVENKLQWIKLNLRPYSNEGKKVTHVFGSFLNVSKEHTEFDKQAVMLANIPGGFHRCYLSDPIHVEYVSKGLCELLGYTRDELSSILVDDDYSLAIYPEDREHFEEFVSHLASKPGVGVCEYRMVRKDGSLISVSDTMESIFSDTGIMYGYSVVFNISNFTNEIETLTDELQTAQVKNSLSQMQPHFLYNALASIREIVLVDPQYASDLIFDFSTHLRACIKAMSCNDCIPFGGELENIHAYVNIEQMRFGEKLKVEYNIQCDDFMIVPLSIQPLVENAIRHGIYQRGAKGGTVSISSFKNDNAYVICVKDDGVGFDYDEIKKEVKNGQRDSTGLNNLIFRLENKFNGKVVIESHIGLGTTVTVTIPFES